MLSFRQNIGIIYFRGGRYCAAVDGDAHGGVDTRVPAVGAGRGGDGAAVRCV